MDSNYTPADNDFVDEHDFPLEGGEQMSSDQPQPLSTSAQQQIEATFKANPEGD